MATLKSSTVILMVLRGVMQGRSAVFVLQVDVGAIFDEVANYVDRTLVLVAHRHLKVLRARLLQSCRSLRVLHHLQ